MPLQLRERNPELNILNFAYMRSGTTILKYAFKLFYFISNLSPIVYAIKQLKERVSKSKKEESS